MSINYAKIVNQAKNNINKDIGNSEYIRNM